MDETTINELVKTLYGFEVESGSLKQLDGYDDLNYALINATDHRRYVLKLIDEPYSESSLTEIMDEVLEGAYRHCAERPWLEFCTPRLVHTATDDQPSKLVELSRGCNEVTKRKFNVKLFEFFADGCTLEQLLADSQKTGKEIGEQAFVPERLYWRLGRLCRQMADLMRTFNHLTEPLRELRTRQRFPWQVASCAAQLRPSLDRIALPEPRRTLIDRVLKEWSSELRPKLSELPARLLHGDLNSKNILVPVSKVGVVGDLNGAPAQLCVIDVQDLQVGPLVIELASFALYLVLEQQRLPFTEALQLLPGWLLAGYLSAGRLPCDLSLELIVPLMRLRLAQSLIMGLVTSERLPPNSPNRAYVLDTQQRGWSMLDLLMEPKAQSLWRSWASYANEAVKSI